MQCKFSKFQKDPSNKSGFFLTEGDATLSDKIYVVQPSYVHSRSPSFSIVARGKHISGLFCVSSNAYLGDHKKQTLIVFLRNEATTLELFLLELAPTPAKNALLSGQLNELFAKARAEAATVA